MELTVKPVHVPVKNFDYWFDLIVNKTINEPETN